MMQQYLQVTRAAVVVQRYSRVKGLRELQSRCSTIYGWRHSLLWYSAIRVWNVHENYNHDAALFTGNDTLCSGTALLTGEKYTITIIIMQHYLQVTTPAVIMQHYSREQIYDNYSGDAALFTGDKSCCLYAGLFTGESLQ